MIQVAPTSLQIQPKLFLSCQMSHKCFLPLIHPRPMHFLDMEEARLGDLLYVFGNPEDSGIGLWSAIERPRYVFVLFSLGKHFFSLYCSEQRRQSSDTMAKCDSFHPFPLTDTLRTREMSPISRSHSSERELRDDLLDLEQ